MWLLIIFCVLAAIPLGYFISKKIFPKVEILMDKKIIDDAEKVVKGERSNIYTHEGEKYDANKFSLPGKNDIVNKLEFG